MMLQGHTIDVLLAGTYRANTAFYAWTFVRGLTACIFLVVSGFVFSVAVARHRAPLHSGGTALRRIRRLAVLAALGYTLHLPVARLSGLLELRTDQLQALFVVDILHCIAVMTGLLSIMRWASRRIGVYAGIAGLACVATLLFTPFMWSVDWARHLPLGVAAYLSPASGSVFPLFPWLAYGFFGAAIGGLYVTLGSRPGLGISLPLAAGGAVLLAASFVQLPFDLLGATDYWTTSPRQFLLRGGLICFVFAGLSHLGRTTVKRPLVRALAQESLTVYFVHMCIVYGSVWAPGLRNVYGGSLSPLTAMAWAVALWGAMIALAWAWHLCKHRQPGLADLVRTAAVGLLIGRLL